jgi:hypothetical protein
VTIAMPSLKRALRRLSSGSGSDAYGWDTTPAALSPEEFQNELVALGLSGMFFTPATYAAALEAHTGLKIRFRCLCDQQWPQFSRALARSGTMAELIYCGDPPVVTILLPGSLPPLLFNLTAYHELGHLAAGHYSLGPIEKSSCKPAPSLSGRVPPAGNDRKEQEADLRARYALVAGSLGPRNPYYLDTYDVL